VNGCCDEIPVLHRFDPVTGYPQVSSDGGVTWTPDPAAIQNQIQLYPPLVHAGSSSTKCDAATNASEHINELIEATSTNLETAGTVFELAVAIAAAVLALFLILVSAGALTAPVTAVATAIWAAATAAFELGKEAFDTYWTVDKKDAILCALFCNIGSNGQFTEAQYQGFRSDIKGTLPASPAFDIVMTSINAGGAIGLSQMASYGNAAEADCSSCTGCGTCAQQWSVFGASHGIIIDQTEEYVEVQAQDPGNGNFYVILKTPTVNSCCTVTSTEFTPADVEIHGWTDCGQPQVEGVPDHTGLGWGTCVNYLQAQSAAPFTVKFFLADCS